MIRRIEVIPIQVILSAVFDGKKRGFSQSSLSVLLNIGSPGLILLRLQALLWLRLFYVRGLSALVASQNSDPVLGLE